MTQAGDLREEIKLEKKVTVSDGAGGTITTWELVATMPARIKVLTAGEQVMVGRLASTQTLVCTVRSQPALAMADTTWRLTNTRSNRVYNVKAFTPDERNAFVDILAQSGVI